MATFSYKAINNDTGEIVEASIEAKSQDQALKSIEAKNLSPFNLKEEGSSMTKEKRSSFFNAFTSNKDNLILFTRQLANLLQAGIQLGEAIDIIIRLLKPGDFKEVVEDIYTSIKSGQNFAEALANYPNYFSTSYINMIRAGEEGGFLDLTCQRLAQDLEDNAELKSFVISSLIYPVILLIVAILAVGVMLTYVLPKFSLIYGNYGQTLPQSTEFLLNMSQFFSNYWLLIILSLGAVGLGLWSYYHTKEGKKYIDNTLLRLPLVGKLITKLAVTKISRSIGSMLESGVPLLKALRISKHISNNFILQEALDKTTLQVKRGGRLSEALDKTGVFPSIFVYMIGVGERTGNLEAILLQVAKNFESDSRQTLEKLMKIFEPLLILLMGGSIGFIIISMLLPILGINDIQF